MKKEIQLSLFIIILIYGLSCKAPRNNPLDPLNPEYNYGIIQGTVQSLAIPPEAISGVTVHWVKDNLITETNELGRFTLDNVPIEDGLLIFSKPGFKSDTLYIEWRTAKTIITQVIFNSIPVLDSVYIYTSVLNRISLQSESQLTVKAWITDYDRDMDSVFIYNQTLGVRRPLTYSPIDRTYQAALSTNELNVSNIEQIVGLNFSIITKDRPVNDTKPGGEFTIGSRKITRVIKEEVSGMHPSTDTTISLASQPVILNWLKFDAGYDYTYLIELYSYTTFTNPQLILNNNNISPDSTKYILPQNLTNGSYYWVVWVVDAFQNRSRSKQATFRIQ